MRLVVGYSTRDRTDLASQTLPPLSAAPVDIFWFDGSTTEQDIEFFNAHRERAVWSEFVYGGADAAIARKLSKMLEHPEYTHLMVLEDDVLLDDDWYEPTMALFKKGKDDGLNVGAVSPRSYVDRILFQRDGYAVMHNIGAGAIIFNREAAKIVLRNFRTHWWPSTRYAFAQLSGIDIGAYACFAGNQQWTTTDWGWEYQLLSDGLSALALTPAKCQMIGQDIPLAEQGLELTTGPVESRVNNEKFHYFAEIMTAVRKMEVDADKLVSMFHTNMGSTLFFPHQLGKLFSTEHGWRLKWTQGWGPFSYTAGPGGASLSVRVAGSCSFLVSGGHNAAANATVVDVLSGFNAHPQLPAFTGAFSEMVEISVPGGPLPRTVALGLSEGGILYGVSCADPQLLNTAYSFSWDKLPEV